MHEAIRRNAPAGDRDEAMLVANEPRRPRRSRRRHHRTARHAAHAEGRAHHEVALARERGEDRHHVVEKPQRRLDHPAVDRGVAFVDALEPGRTKPKERSGEALKHRKANRREGPGLLFEQVRRDRMARDGLGERRHHKHEPAIAILIDLREPRHEGRDLRGAEFIRMKPQLGECRLESRRMQRTLGHRPRRADRRGEIEEAIGDERPANRIGRMARRPSDDDARTIRMAREVPDRVRAPRPAIDRPKVARDRIEHHAVEHAVSIGTRTGRKRGPCDRRIGRHPGDEAA